MSSKMMLIGTVSSEPGITYGIDGEEAIFALKTNVSKGPVSRQETVQWHRIVLMGPFVDMCKNIHVNDIVYVEGILSGGAAEASAGDASPVFHNEVVATDVRVLSKSMPRRPGRHLAAVLIDKIRKQR